MKKKAMQLALATVFDQIVWFSLKDTNFKAGVRQFGWKQTVNIVIPADWNGHNDTHLRMNSSDLSQLHASASANPSKDRGPRAADCATSAPPPQAKPKPDWYRPSVTPNRGSRSAVRGPLTWELGCYPNCYPE